MTVLPRASAGQKWNPGWPGSCFVLFSTFFCSMQPLVSILIPAYNSSEWVDEAIESALAQTWQRKEIVVVDDGSSDDTFAKARRYESESVRVITQSNQGASAARNAALGLAQGDYIQWLDADDLLAPDKIQQQLCRVNRDSESRILLSSAWGYFYYRPWKADFRPNSLWQDLSPVEWMLRRTERNKWMAIETWLVSRELTESVGPWDVSLIRNNDGEYFSRVICQCDGIRFVPEARSYVRRTNQSSITSQDICLSQAQLNSLMASFTKQIGYLRSLADDARARAACVKLLQDTLVWFYFNEKWNLVDQAMQMAAELGGQLEIPADSRKYSLVERLLGRRFTRRGRALAHTVRARLVVGCDKWLSRWKPRRNHPHGSWL